MRQFRIIEGDALTRLREMPDESAHCCITSPPYWGLRDYGVTGQLGMERTHVEYIASMVEVFREVRRVLRSDGTLWLNLGDSYATGAGKVGECPGGGEQGERWRGASNSDQDPKRSAPRGPMTQANRLPQPNLKPKDLCMIPARLAIALQEDGWWLRSDIIWHKPNPMPESVTDRPTTAHEHVFLLAKSERYYYDADAIREPDSGQQHDRNVTSGAPSLEPSGGLRNAHGSLWGTSARNGMGRNKRSVWTIATQPFSGAHFATFPESLVEPCVLAGCPVDGIVLDPFAGSGTTGVVALRHDRQFVGIELNPAYAEMARRRITNDAPMFNAEVCEAHGRVD